MEETSENSVYKMQRSFFFSANVRGKYPSVYTSSCHEPTICQRKIRRFKDSNIHIEVVGNAKIWNIILTNANSRIEFQTTYLEKKSLIKPL